MVPGELARYLAVWIARKRAVDGESLIDAARVTSANFGVPYEDVLRLASRAHESVREARRAIETMAFKPTTED